MVVDGVILKDEGEDFVIALKINNKIVELDYPKNIFLNANVTRESMPFKAHIKNDKIVLVEYVCSEEDYEMVDIELDEEHKNKLKIIKEKLK